MQDPKNNSYDSDNFILYKREFLDREAYIQETENFKIIKDYGIYNEDLLKRWDLIIYLKIVSKSSRNYLKIRSTFSRKQIQIKLQIFGEKEKNIWKHHQISLEILEFEKFKDKLEKLILNLKKFI